MLMINDLTVSNDLDRVAMAAVIGGWMKPRYPKPHYPAPRLPVFHQTKIGYEAFKTFDLSIDVSKSAGVRYDYENTYIVG
jgi:hypothetical protein